MSERRTGWRLWWLCQIAAVRDEQNYYEMRGLVPPDLRSTLDDVSIVITNYHSFLPRTAKEVRGVASNTRKLLRAGRPGKADPFVETDEQIVDRVLRDLAGRGRGEVMVINDEAHHCYQDKPANESLDAETRREAKERNESARVWFRGLRAVAKRVGVKAIFDLSATPFYLGGSGYQEGYIFPWVMSDFSLMDAIESGIVKIPRRCSRIRHDGSVCACRGITTCGSTPATTRSTRASSAAESTFT